MGVSEGINGDPGRLHWHGRTAPDLIRKACGACDGWRADLLLAAQSPVAITSLAITTLSMQQPQCTDAGFCAEQAGAGWSLGGFSGAGGIADALTIWP